MGFLAWNEAVVNQTEPTWRLVNLSTEQGVAGAALDAYREAYDEVIQDVPPSQLTAIVAQAAADAATKAAEAATKAAIGDPGTEEYYSVCGYRDLMPHLHNYYNDTEAIKRFEDELVQDLIFHLFGLLGHSCKNLKDGPNATGYCVRFQRLTVTAKDNIKGLKSTQKKGHVEHPTNRVARGRVYGCVFVPEHDGGHCGCLILILFIDLI